MDDINDAIHYTQSGRKKVSLKFPQFESKHISSSNELQWETRVWGAIINHGAVTNGPFQVGEIFEEETGAGKKTGKRGYIQASDGSKITYDTTHTTMPLGGSNNKFTNGNIIRGLTSNATTAITNCNTGSDHSYDYYTSSIRLKTGLNNGDKVSRQMIVYPPYFSGFEPTIEQTFELDLKDGVRQRIFVGDDLNGIGLKVEGKVVYFFIRTNGPGKANTPGEVKEDYIIPRIAETGKTLNGKPLEWVNGKGINYEKAQIQKIVFKWLGYGAGELYNVQDGKEILCAQANHVDYEEDVYMRTPSLPAHFEIENFTAQTEVTELRMTCVNFSSEGGVLFPGLEFGIPPLPYFGARDGNNPELSLVNTDGVNNNWCLLGLVALRNNWPLENTQENIPADLPNRKTWRWLDDVISVSGKNVIYQLVHIHELRSITTKAGPSYTYDNIPWSEVDGSSAIQFYYGIITDWDASHLHGIGSPRKVLALVGGAGTGIQGSSEFVNAHSTISQNWESKCSQCFAIIAKTLETGTAIISWGISGIEIE